jgi:hypothetical protein
MSEETMESLRARIDAARQRERSARAAATRLAREMSALSRRTETQRLCVLGRAWSAYADAHPEREAEMRAFLRDGYITRDTDRAALDTTRWSVPDPAYVPAAEWLPQDERDEDA